MAGATRLFISYRRDDSLGIAGRIRDRLAQEFGAVNVFFDIDAIPLGVDYRRHIDQVIADCDAVLVIIGRRWVDTPNDQGRPRLDDDTDFVRLEVEAALHRDIPVVPLRVDGAAMPLATQLPPSIAELTYRNGVQVRHDPDFHTDMDRLIHGLVSSRKPPRASNPEAEQREGFDVVLVDVGLHKIQVVKVVRELTTLGLKEAKELVESAPKPLLEQVTRRVAEEAKVALEAAGAAASIA